jgi:osmotically inducible lipoprotein OsmB
MLFMVHKYRSQAIRRKSMRHIKLLTMIIAVVSLFGCARMSPRQQTTLSGGAIGAGGGALLGGISGGSPAVGAVVGGAAGALTGYILGGQGEPRHRYRRDY